MTSIDLACGLAVTSFSDLPTLRLFGWLSAFAMLMALTADLLILRPTITFLSRLSRRLKGERNQESILAQISRRSRSADQNRSRLRSSSDSVTS